MKNEITPWGKFWQAGAFAFWIICMVSLTILVYIKAANIMQKDSADEAKQRMAQIPSYNDESFKLLIVTVEQIINNSSYYQREPQDISTFVDNLTYMNNAKLIVEKKRFEENAVAAYAGPYGYYHSGIYDYPKKIQQAIDNYRQTYQSRWTPKQITYEKERSSWTRHDYSEVHQKSLTWLEWAEKYVFPLLGSILLWYILAGVISNVYFVMTLRVLKNSWKQILWGRFCSGNLLFDNLLWIGVFTQFPRGDSTELMQVAMRRVVTAMTFVLMQCSFAVISISAQKPIRVSEKDKHGLLVEKPEQEVPVLTLIQEIKPEVIPTPLPTPSQRNWKPKVTLTETVLSELIAPHGKQVGFGPVSVTNVKFQFSKFYFDLGQTIALAKPLSPENSANFATANMGVDFNCGKFACDVGATYIGNTPILTKMGGDVVVLYGSVGKIIKIAANQTIKPSVGVKYFLPVNGKNPKGGVMVETGLQYTYSRNNWEINPSIALTADNGIFGSAPIDQLKTGVQVSHKLNKRVTVFASFDLSSPINKVIDGRKQERVVGGGFKYFW